MNRNTMAHKIKFYNPKSKSFEKSNSMVSVSRKNSMKDEGSSDEEILNPRAERHRLKNVFKNQ
jgi:hypothetical protein